MAHSTVICLGVHVELIEMSKGKYGARINNGYYDWDLDEQAALEKVAERIKEIMSGSVDRQLREYKKTLNKLKS